MNKERIESVYSEMEDLYEIMLDSLENFIETEKIRDRSEFIRNSKVFSTKLNQLRTIVRNQWLKGE